MTGAKILVVDDDQTTAKIIKLKLMKMGYPAVSIARSAADALDKARDYCPDLLLMDINLGKGEDGIAAVEKLSEECHVPVIYVTAHADNDTLDRAMKTLPLGYINKPLREADLRATIALALEQIEKKAVANDGLGDDGAKFWKIRIRCDSEGNITRTGASIKKMLEIHSLTAIDELLPKSNKKHILDCLHNRESQIVTRKLWDRVFSCEYFPVEAEESVDITITDITFSGMLAGSNIQQTILLEALNHLTTGLILINENMNIFYTNKSADRLLKTGHGLKRSDGYLSCHTPEITAELQRMILEGSDQMLTISRGLESKPLNILITPLDAHKANYGQNLPIAIVFIFETLDNTERMEDVLRSLYNLSPMEARTAARLVQTPNLDQVARALGVTSNTTRTHLKRIYTKTDTNRLSTLVHMIVTGPAGMIMQVNE
ncbi:MAG: response regulator [Gammaproteobacteria bacterium]